MGRRGVHWLGHTGVRQLGSRGASGRKHWRNEEIREHMFIVEVRQKINVVYTLELQSRKSTILK